MASVDTAAVQAMTARLCTSPGSAGAQIAAALVSSAAEARVAAAASYELCPDGTDLLTPFYNFVNDPGNKDIGRVVKCAPGAAALAEPGAQGLAGACRPPCC